MSTQLTFDGTEVSHPPPRDRDWRLYVVLWELEERRSFGWVGVIGARNPSDARKRSRQIHGIPAESPLVAIALRNWNVTSETAAVGVEDAQATKGKGS